MLEDALSYLGIGRGRQLPELRPHRVVTTSGVSIRETIALANALALRPEEAAIVDALKLIDDRIEGFRATLSASDESWRGDDGDDLSIARAGVIVRLRGVDEPVPIGSLGDGVWRMLGLALSAAAARGGFLLVDEIDTGLHYTALEKMWRMVFEAAKRFDVQVFATTHSRDCLDALAAIARPDVEEGSEVSIHRIEPDKDEAVSYNEAQIVALAEDGGEAR